ncbi:probable calcium-binding protein CML25 [Papaver somniferum]|uniref:probable calcium-binding protein CML25 n=1 Tax=Papaver somniferum TaxID=3469 RepID=UPI000E6F5D7E|nr:probable calcium-binding protein CML25 [Papaver somniferum]
MGIRSLLGKKKKQNNNSMGDLSSTYETPPQSPSIFMNSSNKKVQEFEEIFKKFDVNGDGKIEWSELGLIMSSLGHNAEEEELKKGIFNKLPHLQIPIQENATVCFAVVVATELKVVCAWLMSQELQGVVMNARTGDMTVLMLESFTGGCCRCSEPKNKEESVMDYGWKNGGIFLNCKLEVWHFIKIPLKKMVKEVDSDGDGFIDLDEFIELNTIDPEKLLEDVKSAFTILDANGDGSISPQELQKVLRSLGESPTLEDCKNMIKGVDCDGDGLVSFEEFKKMMIRGSASTDHFLQRNASKNENQEVQQ